LQENDETSETISHSWFDQVVKALHSDIQAIGMDLQRAMQRYDNRQTQT
jgi:outer membrane murein-binding lipoprotein Lpp